MCLRIVDEGSLQSRRLRGGADPSEAKLAQMAQLLPHVTSMVASELHAADGDVLGWCDSPAEFEFTLDLLLDGLEAQRVAST